MRILDLSEVSLAGQDGPTLTYRGARGERVTLSVLEHDLIRVRHEPDGAPRLDRTWLIVGPDGDTPREGRLRADLSPFSLPAYTFAQDGPVHHLHTERLHLTIHTDRLALEWADGADRRFAADLAMHAYAYDARGQAVWHYLERATTEHYYGFGEKAGPLDKHGQRLRMLNLNAFYYDAETSDPLYKHWPFYITYVPELDIAYGLLYDNLATSVFDLGREVNGLWGPHRYYQADGGDLDYTLIYGPTIPEVLAKFARLTGKPCLPPRWTLGYWGSTMRYTEAPDAHDQLRRFIALCQQHDIPCDGFHLSSGYTTDDQGRRHVFQWNRAKLPDPAAMIADFHAAGMHLSANIKPYLLRSNPGYAEVAARQGFIQDADGSGPEPVQSWSGGIYQTEDAAYVDFTSAAGFDWWAEKATEALLDYGIDALWNDNNEFEVANDEARCDGFGEPLPAGLTRPLHTLLMGRSSFEAARRHHPDSAALRRDARRGTRRPALRPDLVRGQRRLLAHPALESADGPRPEPLRLPQHRARRGRLLRRSAGAGAVPALGTGWHLLSALHDPLDRAGRASHRTVDVPGTAAPRPGGDPAALPADPVPLQPAVRLHPDRPADHAPAGLRLPA